MAVTAKSAYEQERQALFNNIRHFVSTKCEPPQHLTYGVMLEIMELLQGYPMEQKK